jgi:hypothetical protein
MRRYSAGFAGNRSDPLQTNKQTNKKRGKNRGEEQTYRLSSIDNVTPSESDSARARQ